MNADKTTEVAKLFHDAILVQLEQHCPDLTVSEYICVLGVLLANTLSQAKPHAWSPERVRRFLTTVAETVDKLREHDGNKRSATVLN